MSIQNLSDQFELVRLWNDFIKLKGAYDGIKLQIESHIEILEKNIKYIELASEEEKNIVSMYKI